MIHYLDRGLVADLLNVKEHTLAVSYLGLGNKMKREDMEYRNRFITVRKQVNNSLTEIEHDLVTKIESKI